MRKITAALLCTSILLTGCTGVATPSESVPSQTTGTEISFSWWGNDVRHEYTMNGVDVFQNLNPDITVKNHYGVWQGYEKRTNVAIESHTETDVMQINYAWLSTYSPDGTGFYDLYSLSDELGLNNFDEDDLQYGIIEGKLNALPIAFNTYEVFYNTDLWEKYGLEKPDSLDDFYEAAKVMSPDGIYPLGMVKKMVFLLMCANYEQTHGTSVFSSDGQLLISESDAADMLSLYRDLIDNKVLIPVDDFERSKFGDGTIASTMCWVSDAGNYCGSLADKGGNPDIAGFLIPENAASTGWYIKPATMYAISAYTEHPHESARLLNFLINSPEMAALQLSEKGVPVSRSALDTVNNIPDAMSGFEYAASRYMNENRQQLSIIKPIMEKEEVIDIFKKYGDEYIYDQLTLKEASAAMLVEMKSAVHQ